MQVRRSPFPRSFLFAVGLTLPAGHAAAEAPAPRSTAPAPPTEPAASSPPTIPSAANTHGRTIAGISIIVASLAAGAAVTYYGLTFDCVQGDHGCQRRASLPIWGGVAIASAGSLVGLGLLQTPDGASVASVRIGGHFD